MGNSVSSRAGGCYIHINDESRTYEAGSTIFGEVRRHPDHRPSETNRVVVARGFRLYFVGEEDVAVVSSSTGGGGGTRFGGFVEKTKVAKRDIVRADIPINATMLGDAVAFQFQIPNHLPSSMFYKDKNGGHCSIRYKVKLMRPMTWGGNPPPLRDEVPVEIVAKSPSATPMPYREKRVQRIAFLRCIPRGCVSWTAGLSDSRVGAGEDLIINLAVENDSPARLGHVTAALEETVAWRISRRHSSRASRSHESHPQNFEFGNKNTENDDRVVLRFSVPEYSCQSYSGRLMTIQHRVRIEAAMATPFHTTPTILIPIEVVRPRDVPIARDVPVATAMLAPMPSHPLKSDNHPSAVVVAARVNGTSVETTTKMATVPNPSLRSESVSDSECSYCGDVAPSAPPYESRPSAMMANDRVNWIEVEPTTNKMSTVPTPSAPPLRSITDSDRERLSSGDLAPSAPPYESRP
ncbi:hypothetical protein ACHAXA_002129 [Cyclostephanos tholiformis]|uniref:Arrestin C-terminal-like domain-containing protein n=1 Tax=Cyclostephanos tholiformis TaxID=382380 RepID=A0ABD3RQW9_9STRA